MTWGKLNAATPLAKLEKQFVTMLGRANVITDRQLMLTYDSDGLTHYRKIPSMVVMPRSAEQIGHITSLCALEGVPFVARGSGTGLSGGSLPVNDGVVISLTKLDAVLEIDYSSQVVVVEPGVINIDVTRAVQKQGFYYAPDPSSQRICSIGGNVAENAGGAHCLKHGFTTNHISGLQLVTAKGDVVRLGGRALDYPGYDLIGALVGSEGTLGIVSEVTVRLSRKPERVETILAAFSSNERAAAAVSDVIARGILPAAIEFMDAIALEAAEAAVHCGYPVGAAAVVILELDGPSIEVDAESELVMEVLSSAAAFEIRRASDPAERERLWEGRKSAFAAVGRLSPNYIVQDGVVPRSRLVKALDEIDRLSREYGLRVANVFHAGDGNLHPLVLFDKSKGEAASAEALSGAILEVCLELGGSITGEHGVGVEKTPFMDKMFSSVDLDTMRLLRRAFDPDTICNPGKLIPLPRLCGEATAGAVGRQRAFA